MSKNKNKSLPPKPVIENDLIVVPNLTNGLADAVGFNAGPGIGGGSAFGYTGGGAQQAVSDTSTAFENLRWYLVSNFRQLLSELYVEIGLVQTIVNVPVDDGLRGGVMFKSKQLDEDQIKDLMLAMDRDRDLDTAGWAAKWTRLFGGGGILILVADQDPETPLDLASIGTDTEVKFRAVDMWELFEDQQNVETYDMDIGREDEDEEFYSYYNHRVHKSRVLAMKGMEAPSFIRPRLRGWGVSCVEALIRSMNQYLKATDLGFEVLDEFKLDIYKIKNLVTTLLSQNGTAKIKERVQMANWQKNYQNAIVMDSEDDFDHKQLSFTGLAEAMAGIRTQVAADMRMPILKLFGQSFSSGGMGSSSSEEMENYNSMVEAEVRGKLKYHILKMGEVKCQQLFGFIPDDLEGEFKPLRELGAVDQETVKTQKFTRLSQAKAAGEVTTLEFRDAANKGNLFDVQLDTTEDSLNPDDPEIEDVLAGKDAEIEHAEAMTKATGGNDEEKPGAAKPKEKKVENDNPFKDLASFTIFDRITRVVNSTAFDHASYDADGGDEWIDGGRKDLFTKDFASDTGLYSKCQAESENIFGGDNWKFTVWLYKKQGGKFS